jgi:hypothetical protein
MATDAYLENNRLLLQQTATRSDRDIRATQTVRAVQDAQRRTQIALEATSTQAQLQRQATDSALAFQQTRTALGEDVTASPENTAPQGIVPQQVASVTPPAPATAIPQTLPADTPVVLIPPSDTPYATPSGLLLETTFSQGFDDDIWLTGMRSDWFADTDGIQATRDQAWLLSEELFGGDYGIEIQMTPRLWQRESYWLLLGMMTDSGYAIQYQVEDKTLRQVRLYLFESSVLTADSSLSADTAIQLETESVEVDFSGSVTLRAILRGGQLTVMLGDEVLMETALAVTTGQIGVQVPAGTELNMLRVEQVTR